ncbi:hypothetical protein [Inconstantimicrobium mannanitabidum]|uniref:Uncharacterized protein n=1 Tax=Inconstantimicrobium mannanitabidum TaxID=1604901 RepID=A0ACB5RE23_9CLOT|nr:hypothetical protein [Clostridium sp. TW13]GKX67288.1 hypothetical protein rsdtw13_25460 [Clostridium sp. TW13]
MLRWSFAFRDTKTVEKFRRENKGEKVLAVAIRYHSKGKEHKCKIEEI